jgi:CRP-like cAMP-binding protein
MDDEEKELLRSIDARLEALLRLRLENHFDDDASTRDKAKLLNKMDFSNQEMAEIIGTTPNTISTTLSRLRKEGEIDD